MSVAAVPRDSSEAPTDSGLRRAGGFTESGHDRAASFLEINLESLRLSAETQRAVRDAAPRGRVQVLDDGTALINDGSTLLGAPLPVSDVFAQLSGLDAQHVVVIFGIGTGQLPRLVRAMCRVPIVIYEPDPRVLRAVLEHGPLDLADIPVVSGIADLTRFWREFAMRKLDVRVLTTPGYYRAYPDDVKAFVDAIPLLLERAAITKATFQNRGKVWIQDIIANVELLEDAPPFLTLESCFKGVPAFIIGAGPSLDRNIHLLEEAATKGIVFATNSGAVALAARGIEPQVVCCIESIDASSKLAGLFFMSRAVRAFSLAAAPETLRTGAGPLLPVHEAVAQYSGPLSELTRCSGLPMSSSVSTVATSLARMLGCSPIVLVGQDLAYSGGRTYAKGTGYETSKAEIDDGSGVIHLKWNDEALRVHGEAQGPQRTHEELRRVPAWGGQGEVESGAGFTGIISWFEGTAAATQAGGETRWINATEGGVHIEGFEDLPLAEVLAGLPERRIGAPDIASAARARWTPISRQTIADWLTAHAAAARRVRRAARRVRRHAELAAVVTRSGEARSVTRVYDQLERSEAELRAAVARCPLVDAWSHRAVDGALAAEPDEPREANLGPRGAAQESTRRSARLAGAVERAARELERALDDRAQRLRIPRRSQPDE